MASPFGGLFTGSTQTPPAAASSAKPFSGLFTPAPASAVAPVAPVVKTSTPAAPITSPVSTTSGIPASALKGNLGGGYGASNIKDEFSGKPLLTYENQDAKASQLLKDRVAPTFDPTVPQKIDPNVLHNGRMPEAASEAVRKATGAEPDEQLDHLISLELGGSNDTSNLNNEKLKSDGTQPSLTLENATAKAVANGDKTGVSYIDGQKIIARAKGVQLPDDQDFSSSPHPLAGGYPNPAPNQTGTQSQTQKPNMFEGILTGKTTSGQPTLLAKAGNYIKDAFTNPGATSKPLFDELGGEAIVHPIQTLNTIVNNAKQGIDTSLQNLTSSAKTIVAPNQSASQRTASVLNFLTSAASTLFTPVSETFNIASQLPIIKPAADATGLLFDKTGQVGGFAADKLLSALPISQDAKNNLTTAVHNVGTLAGQIILGGHIYGAITGLADAKGEITPEQEKTVVADANDKAQQLNKASMPTTAQGSPAPVKAEAAETGKAPEPVTAEPKETTPTEPVAATKTSGIAKSIEANAIAKGLTDKFENLAGFEGKNVKDQAAKVADFITNNEVKARDAVTTQKLPEGMSPTMFLKGMEDFAMKNGDADLMQKLASSPITSESSVHAQELRFAGERDPNSPVEKIKDVQSAREKNLQNKNGGKSVDVLRDKVGDDVTKEIKKASSRPRDWSAFIDEIQC